MIRVKQVKGKGKKYNEDVVYIEDKNIENVFVGVADGQSNKQFCVEGGMIALRKAAEYFKTKEITTLKEKKYVDEIQYGIISLIRDGLKEASRIKNQEIEEFSSTLCAVVIDQKGDFIIVNLGDGLILGVTKENKVRILSHQERGIVKNSTYLTTSAEALTHVRLGWGNIKEYKTLLLFTDGVKGIYRSNLMSEKMMQLLIQEDYLEIEKIIEASENTDDATMIIIKTEYLGEDFIK